MERSLADPVAEMWEQVADADPISYYWKEPPDSGRYKYAGPGPFQPGRRLLYRQSETPLSTEEEIAGAISLLQRLQRTLQSAPALEDAASPGEPGLSVLQAKRLSRTGVAPAPFDYGALPKPLVPRPEQPAAKPDATGTTAKTEPPSTPAATVPVPPAKQPAKLHPRGGWSIGFGFAVLVVLGMFGVVVFFWNRVQLTDREEETQPRETISRAAEAAPSEEALKSLAQAMEAMQHGELKSAADLLANTRKLGGGLRGLAYQSALVAFRSGQPEQAARFLDQSIAANEAVADCWYLRANATFFAAGPERAAEDFQQAIYAAPFNPRYYFFRAECLRRNGNTAQALEEFQRALRCRPSSADAELIQFKMGLARLESNTEAEFKIEVSNRLNREPVAGDSLLLAAADAINRSDYSDAADKLKRAAQALPLRTFQSRVRDYVFRAQSAQPEVAAALKSTLAAGAPAEPGQPQLAAAILVDPATRSLGEADPAGW